jgi:hypothetical protein
LTASSAALAFSSSNYLYLGDGVMTSFYFSVFYGVDGLTSIAYPYGAFFTSGVYSWDQMDKE